jgi:thiosulfate dehydrogenase (quinone) large subunit
MNTTSKLSGTQANAMVVLRLLIGWHFLYEGVIKLYSPTWTAKSYLLSASFITPFFRWLANDSLLPAIDVMNIGALMVVGASLILGFKTRWACAIGIGLLLLYFFAHPPFPGLPQGPSEGSYWLVNKNLIEAAALWVLFVFPTETIFGIELFFDKSELQNQKN